MVSLEVGRAVSSAFELDLELELGLEREPEWPDCPSGRNGLFKRGGGPKGAPPTIPPIIIKRPKTKPADAPIDPHTTLPGPPIIPPPAPPISIAT